MAINAYNFIFMLTYATVTAVFSYLIIRYALYSERQGRGVKVRKISTLSRLRFLFKISLTIMQNALTILIAFSIVLAALAASYSATSRTGYVSLQEPLAGGGQADLLVKFKRLMPASKARQVLSTVLAAVTTANRSTTYYSIGCVAYHMLSRPARMMLRDRVVNIYVLIGLPKEILKELFPNALASGAEIIYSMKGFQGLADAMLKLPNAREVKVKVAVVRPSEILEKRLAGDIPLLPVQSYLGRVPVETPPKYVLVGELSYVNSLLGIGGDMVNTAYSAIAGGVRVEDLLKAWGLIRDYVLAITLIEKGRVVIVSGTQVPTLKSLASAVVSTAMACILCLSITASLVPKLRSLYRKLSLIGMPSWCVRVINSVYTSSTVLAPGLAVTLASYIALGGVSAFNSLLTTLITWVAFTLYMHRRSGIRRFAGDVYMRPLTRYAISVVTTNLRGVLNEVRTSIEGNEFFHVNELEERVFSERDAALHARLTYKETWGVGLDVEVLVSVADGCTHISIYSNVWGIEEVSESLMKDVLALALSRIVGRLRVWELLLTYS